MRPERLYLSDIVEAADAIRKFVEDLEETEFIGNDMIRSAVLQKLTVIGEAASHLPSEFCDRHPGVPWREIADFRNIAVHAYFAVEWPIVWVAANEETPTLRGQVAEILAKEFSDDHPA